jgi:tRNA1(Val) A37 N6-methylase TrmN6
MEIMRAVSDLLKTDGRAFFVYPAGREGDFLRAAEARGLRPRVIRRIVPREGEPPNHFLAEIGHSAAVAGLETVLPPLVLHPGPGGGFGPEAEAMLEGRWDENYR